MKLASTPFEDTEVSFTLDEADTDPHKAAAVVKRPYGFIVYVALGGATTHAGALDLIQQYFASVSPSETDLH